MNKRKGITLIVLVITIILVIILAGAVILSLINTNIMGTASTAVIKNENSIVKEKFIFEITAYYFKLMDNPNYTIMEHLKSVGFLNENNDVNIKNIIENPKTGLGKIVDKKDVYILQDNTLYYYDKDSNKESMVVLPGSSSSGDIEEDNKEKPAGDITNENKTFDGLTPSYKNPIIPKGFKPINTETSTWENLTTDENEYKKGMVIEDDVGNQFVWIGVDKTNVNLQRKDWITSYGETYRDSSESTTTTEYVAMSGSINKYGGFYLARYEAGLPTNKGTINKALVTTIDGSVKPVFKKGYSPWNNTPWGVSLNVTTPGNGMVTIARNMYPLNDPTKGATSVLCYDAAWDAALSFIALTNPSYPTDFENRKKPEMGVVLTGVQDTKASNIYDMFGNVMERTMALSNYYGPILRGGYYSMGIRGGPAGVRYSIEMETITYNIGFRVVLYIK